MSEKPRYSKVVRRMWNDAKFRELSSPPPNAQTLWQRLLTGPELSNIPGLFAAWDVELARALKWPIEGFLEAFAEVYAKGMAKADWEAGLVWVPNAPEHNKPESPNVIRSWATAWEEMPECSLKLEAYQSLKAFAKGWGEGFAKAFAEACRCPSPNQEQEQDQEQEIPPLPPEGGEEVIPSNCESGVLPTAPEQPRPIPKHVAALETPMWIAAYERAVIAETKNDAWSFDRSQIGILEQLVSKLATGEYRANVSRWISDWVPRFIQGVRSDDLKLWSAYNPKGLRRWFNENRPGYRAPVAKTAPRPEAPPKRVEPTMTPAEYRAAAERLNEAMKNVGNGA